MPETHFLNQQDGGEEKRITDTAFKIVGKEEKKFRFECQSTADSNMLVRWQQFDWLMPRLEIEQPKAFRKSENTDDFPVDPP